MSCSLAFSPLLLSLQPVCLSWRQLEGRQAAACCTKTRGLLGGACAGLCVLPAGTTTSPEPLITAATNQMLELILKPASCCRSGKGLPGTPALEHRALSPGLTLAMKASLPPTKNPLADEKHSLTASGRAQAQCSATLFVCESHLLPSRPSLVAVSLCRKRTPHRPAVSNLPASEHIRAIVSLTFEAGRPGL